MGPMAWPGIGFSSKRLQAADKIPIGVPVFLLKILHQQHKTYILYIMCTHNGKKKKIRKIRKRCDKKNEEKLNILFFVAFSLYKFTLMFVEKMNV